MTEIVYTGKLHLKLALFSHIGIAPGDEASIEIAKRILEGYGNLALTVTGIDGKEEYCFTMSEFPPSLAWRKEEGLLQGIGIIDMATEEFFRAASSKSKRITCMLFSHLGITDKDTREVEIAKQIAQKNETVKLVVLDVENVGKEYCFIIDEFPPVPLESEGNLVFQNIDAIGAATNEFFEQVKKK